MATDTATATAPTSAAPADPLRHLWQVPLLLLGVAVFVSAWQGWLPIGRADPESEFVRDLAALKAGYEKLAPDPAELRVLLNKVAAGVEAFPEHTVLARFHLGGGYVRLAELTASPDEARGYWTLARQHFDLIPPNSEKKLRDPAGPPKLSFRAAKARAACGLPANAPTADVALLIAVLSSQQQQGEESGETQRLIADLALRLTPPDVVRAKIALAQYVQGTGTATPPASIARGRLRLGELHFAAGEFDQARKVLLDVDGKDVPADVLAPAKALAARVLMAEGNWVDAAKQLDVLRAAQGVPAATKLTATYQLGVCKLKMHEPEAARPLFEEVAKGDGPEAFASAVQLAGLHLRATEPARHKLAVDLLASAVKGMREPKDFDATLVPLNEVQAVFELAVTTLLADGAHEQALRVAEAYAPVSAAGRDREKRAEVMAAWGTALQKQKAPPAEWKPKFKAAADEFAALAAFQPKTDGKLDLLRRSAAYARLAEDPDAAAARLEEAVKLPGVPEQLWGPLWVELADALLAAGRTDQVFPVFRKAIAEDLTNATRYRLARQFVDSRHPGLVPVGRALFEQIAKQQNVTPADREYHERALTELANAQIREGNFADAEARLRAQLALYPNGPEAGLAKLLLGVCLLQRAAPLSTPTATAAQLADATKLRTEAVGHFKQIVKECDEAERANRKLTDHEAWLRLQAGLRVLQSYQQLRTPQASRALIAEAASLLERYRGTVEELIIWSLVYHAFKQLGDTGKALETRDRMRDVFDKLLPSSFPQKDGEYSRDYWVKVWFTDPK